MTAPRTDFLDAIRRAIAPDATAVRGPSTPPTPSIASQVGGFLGQIAQMATNPDAYNPTKQAFLRSQPHQSGQPVALSFPSWIGGPEGEAAAFKNGPSALDALLERMSKARGPSNIPITPAGNEVLVHGTAAANAPKIEAAGRLDPSQGTRQYADLDFHRSAAYAARPGKSLWTDPELAADSRAVPYTDYFGVSLPEDARVMRVQTADHAEQLARSFGVQPSEWSPNAASESWRAFSDSPTPMYGRKWGGYAPENDRAKNAIDKLIRGWRLDALDIGPEAAEAMGTAPQVVILDPKKSRIVGRVDPTTGRPR